MPDTPLVSVIVPVFNGERYLAAALESIFAQTYRPLDVIVIDDGSTDNSARVSQSFPVKYIFQEHAGLGAALNHGVEHSRGDFISFLDADDLWVPTKLAQQMACLDRDPQLDMVFSYAQEFQESDQRLLGNPSEGYFKGTMLIRRASFYRVGLFDPKLPVGDFIDWYLRASELKLKSVMLPEILLMRRVHDNNMSRERDLHRTYLHILKQSLHRRSSPTL